MTTSKTSATVIVTGATGFVGQHLIPLLLNNNYRVVAIARDMKKASFFPWFKDVQFFALDFHKDNKAMCIEHGAGLIHLAWQGLPNYKSHFHIEENLPFNYRFIKSLVLSGIQQALITGTCFEYGTQIGAIGSTAETYPDNPYAVAKDSLRQQLEFLSKEHPFCLQWARLFYMYGKGQNPRSLLSQLDSAIDNNEALFDMSGGEQLRDYLPIEAAAQQLFELYESGLPGVSNICSGNPISVRRLVEERIQARGSAIKLNLGHYPYPDYEPMEFWGVRDIGETFFLPVLPNAALENKQRKQAFAPMRLRRNSILDFVENEAFDPDLIDYSENYENSQACSAKFKSHMSSVLALLKREFPKNSLIVEVGCGKGDFLEMVQADTYFQIKGYDAAYDGQNKSIERRYLQNSDRIQADIVVLRHVLEHIPRPYEFLSMLKIVFGRAKIYIEVPNYDWIVSNKTFFDITYEHINYFSQNALRKLFESTSRAHGVLFDEQYQYVISDISSLNVDFDLCYKSMDWKFVSFNELFPNMQCDIRRLEELSRSNSVFLWGAATKGCLFLAHCKNQRQLLDKVKFAIDQNPQKIGKYLPGSHVEIKSKHEFFATAKSGDLLLISNPAYKDEILAEIKAADLREIRSEVL